MAPSILGFSPLVAAYVFGLLGGAHCVRMCDGIMGALSFSVPPELRRPRRVLGLLLGFNAGRITSYIVLGALVGVVGIGLSQALDGVALVLRVVAAVMLILMALYIANWRKGLVRIESLSRYVWEFVAPIEKRFMPVVRARQAFGLGRSGDGCPAA